MNSVLDDRRESRRRGRPSLRSVLQLVDEEVRLLHDRLGGLPRAVEADQILRAIWIDDVHNSTAIEGNTMSRVQVEALVERRQASGGFIENLEVEGYARAACGPRHARPVWCGPPAPARAFGSIESAARWASLVEFSGVA